MDCTLGRELASLAAAHDRMSATRDRTRHRARLILVRIADTGGELYGDRRTAGIISGSLRVLPLQWGLPLSSSK